MYPKQMVNVLPEKRPKRLPKEFKWDAIRFANKTYAVFETYKSAESKWVVWIDADTFVHSPISYKQFEDLLPDDKWITFVGRGRGTQTWPECGFYGLNRTNDTCKKFMQQFELMYEDADKGILTLDEWHDSFVFGYILKKIAKLDINPNMIIPKISIINRPRQAVVVILDNPRIRKIL